MSVESGEVEAGPTVAALVRAQEGRHHRAILGPDVVFDANEVYRAAMARAAWLRARRRPGPFHVALLMDNTAEHIFWLEACALVGAVVVGANPTHRGDELVRDLSHTECQILVTTAAHLHLLEGRRIEGELGDISADNDRVVVVDQSRQGDFAEADTSAETQSFDDVTPESLGYLLFTSGTSGAPKAVRCTQGRLARIGTIVAQMFSLGEDDVCYLPMPLFHSNALMAGWGPALAAGAAVALPESGRFSASGFLDDIRRHGATYFNYVGKPLAYILATPERPDDADNPITRAFGNEGASEDVNRFAARFGCTVTDAYGSTEGGAIVSRTPDTPPEALGRAPEGTVIIDSESGEECPHARFDEHGRLTNAAEAIGELVSKSGTFEGYWNNEDAERARLKDGWYWTGDLAFRDEDGFFYFAGRDHDWLRVDGENFASAPIERILTRHPDVVVAAVYAVPDPIVGDQVMAAIEMQAAFDADEFATFLSAQDDLGTKWAPRFIRIADRLPLTATQKVLKRVVRQERWHSADPIWWRPPGTETYQPLTDEDRRTLDEAVVNRPL